MMLVPVYQNSRISIIKAECCLMIVVLIVLLAAFAINDHHYESEEIYLHLR